MRAPRAHSGDLPRGRSTRRYAARYTPPDTRASIAIRLQRLCAPLVLAANIVIGPRRLLYTLRPSRLSPLVRLLVFRVAQNSTFVRSEFSRRSRGVAELRPDAPAFPAETFSRKVRARDAIAGRQYLQFVAARSEAVLTTIVRAVSVAASNVSQREVWTMDHLASRKRCSASSIRFPNAALPRSGQAESGECGVYVEPRPGAMPSEKRASRTAARRPSRRRESAHRVAPPRNQRRC